MGPTVGYNFLKYPCLAEIDFVRGYFRRRLPIQFTYLSIPDGSKQSAKGMKMLYHHTQQYYHSTMVITVHVIML